MNENLKFNKSIFKTPYFQGIICNRDQRESGKKRNFWTNVILVTLIISIVLLIICITLGLDGNNSWWIYFTYGLLGVIGCLILHYFNTKQFIENSKYDKYDDDIDQFSNNKMEIKETISKISKLHEKIKDIKRDIEKTRLKIKVQEKSQELVQKTKELSQKLYKGKGIEIDTEHLNTLNDDLTKKQEELNNTQEYLKKLKLQYERLYLINNYHKNIKMANKYNINIIYNITDFYKDLPLLKDIKYIDPIEIDEYKQSTFVDDKSVYNEYMQIISDINTINNLKNHSILDKIDAIMKSNFSIPYLKTIKNNMLDNYIDIFIEDIENTLIKNSDIDKYGTISKQYSDIYTSLNLIKQKQFYFKSKYEEKKEILIPKYTKITIEEINNMYNNIKSNNYNIDLYKKLKNKYELYSKYELSPNFNIFYNKIIKDLVNNFGDYVFKSLDLKYNLENLNTIESIDTYIKNIKDDSMIKKQIYDFAQHPILSLQSNKNDFLMEIILRPLIDKKTILEKSNIIYNDKKQETTFLSNLFKKD